MNYKAIIAITAILIFGSLYMFIRNQNSIATSQTQAINEMNDIKIESFNFSPAVTRVKVGSKITWTNLDSTPHTISSNLFTSPTLKTGEKYTFSPATPGTIDYSCSIHPSMQGKIVAE